jgi:UPF0755 protein
MTASAAMAKLATPLFGGSKGPARPEPVDAKANAASAAASLRAKTDQVKAEIAKIVPQRPDASVPERPAAGRVTPAPSRPAGADLGSPQLPGRGGAAGELELPVSVEPKRITPRSPRAALQPENVPPPKRPPEQSRPSRRARNPLVVVGNAIFTLLVLALLIGGGAIVVGMSRFEAPGPLTEDKVVTIPPRSGMMDIADLLKAEGVIDEHRLIFAGGVLAMKARGGLKAGEYLFQKHASVRDVVETIVEGKVVQHQITVPEGLTSEQIVAKLLENNLLSGNIKEVPREGSLLPDSYNFHRGFSREQMIARMRQAQDRVMREVWERRSADLPVRTPEQLLILASIIEKETSKPEERTRVAAVFVNRLKQKMKLQSDPTIVYGLVFGKGSLGRPITRSDIQSQTAYNTYVIEGLPPGPITNPGRASIEAAANPARTKELFFVADGTGGHAFAETYEQHQRNVAKWRAIEREARLSLLSRRQCRHHPRRRAPRPRQRRHGRNEPRPRRGQRGLPVRPAQDSNSARCNTWCFSSCGV